MLISVDYFKGALQIPNLDKDTTAFENNYITPYEKEILVRLLGYDLYNQFITNYDTETDDEWKALAEGADFTVSIDDTDYTVHWNGLINSEEISLIAYYVYYNYVKQNYQQLTGLGVISSNVENGTIIDPNEKLVWANNECVKLAGEYPYKINYDYAELLAVDYPILDSSLFNFIVHNITDYPKWVYNPLLPMNILGI